MNIQAQDIMMTNPLTLNKDMPIALAVDSLIAQEILSAPVVNQNGELEGFLSVHDVMVDLWCEDYCPNEQQSVVDLMKKSVVTIDINESLVNIIELLCIDKEQLYPISSVGIGTSNYLVSCSLEERAKKMKITNPKTLPVVSNGILVGLITRLEAVKALRYMYGEKFNVSENITELEVA